MSIYSNDNIRKIAKLTTRELPQKSKNAKITVRENNGLYSNCMIFKIKYNFVILELIGRPYFDLKRNNSKKVWNKSLINCF